MNGIVGLRLLTNKKGFKMCEKTNGKIINDYIVISSDCFLEAINDEFCEEVKKFLKEGYSLHGQPFINETKDKIYQALVKCE